jgi:hypothetical protein
LAAGSAISALVSTEAFFRAKTFTRLLDGNTGFATIGTWNGIGAICDIVIALVMPYFLMRHGTGLDPTHVMIVKIVRLILETGTFTAMVAILHLCLYFANLPAFLVPGLCLSKAYANTMLILFNNRIKLVDGRSGNSSEDDRENMFRSAGGRSEQLPSPTTRKSTTRNTSTVFVSNNRLVFRLADIPPSPVTRPQAEESSAAGKKRTSLEHDLASSAETKSDASIHDLKLMPSLSYTHLPHVPMDSKV